MVFAKNEDGGILPQSRRAQRNAAIANGYAEANKNYQAYSKDLKVLEKLNEQLDNNGQAITDNEQRMAKANETTKNASQRAKDYGKQIATNAKTLTDFKRENEVKEPEQQKQGKWSDGLKSMASAGLSMIGNAFISAGVGMLVQGAFSLLGKGIDAFVHKNENLIAKGQEAKESIQSQTKAYEDQKASLGELTSKYTELSKGVKISGNSIKNISLTDDEYKDFLDTSNQIAAAAPSLTRSWDSQGNAILNAGTNAEDLNTQVNDYLKLQRNLTYYDTKKNISDQYKGYETALGTNKGKRDEYKNAYDAAKYKVDSVQKFSDMLKKHTKGEDTITYTLDQTAYDALGNTFGKAIKGYTLPKTYIINNTSDCHEDYIYPLIKISPKSHGTITIQNVTDNNGTMKINALKDDDFYIDCQHLKIYDITNSIISFEDLGVKDIDNIYWLRLAYGENELRFTGDATFELIYREPRKVGAFG